MDDLRTFAESAQAWASSTEGQKAIQEGAQRAAKMSEELRKAQQVKPESLYRPVTI